MSPWLQHTSFAVIAIISVVASLLVVTRRNPTYSALFLIVVFAAMAMAFLLLGAEYLGFMQLLVYAGAIMVLYLFVIMLINPREGDLPDEGSGSDRVFAGAISLLVFCLLQFTISSSPRLAELDAVMPSLPNALAPDHGSPAAFGRELFREHLLVFELASILILVGIVGAVHLSLRARRRPEAETDPATGGGKEVAGV